MVEHSDLWTELGMLHQMILQDFMKCRKNCTKNKLSRKRKGIVIFQKEHAMTFMTLSHWNLSCKFTVFSLPKSEVLIESCI